MVRQIVALPPLVFVALTLMQSGCSTTKPPRQELARAEQAVDNAAKGRAPQYAPADFQQAVEKLARAKDSMERDNYRRARRLSEQAEVDAEFAEARAEAAYAERMLSETRENARALRQEALE